MSWHERWAYLFGVLTGATTATWESRPWPITIIILIALAGLGASVSLYLDKTRGKPN